MQLVVTGVDDSGRSCVTRRTQVDPCPGPGVDYRSEPVYDGPDDGGAELVRRGASGPAGARVHDPGLRGGSAWRAVRYAPHGTTDMHRTSTVDYDVVLHGTLTLELEAEEVELVAGDMVVVTGVPHRWKAGAEGGLLTALMVPFGG